MSLVGAQSSNAVTILPKFGVFEKEDPQSLFQLFIKLHGGHDQLLQNAQFHIFKRRYASLLAANFAEIVNSTDAYFHNQYAHLDEAQTEQVYLIRIKKMYTWKHLIEFHDFMANMMPQAYKSEYGSLALQMVLLMVTECSAILPSIVKLFAGQKLKDQSYYYYHIAILDMTKMIMNASGNIEIFYKQLLIDNKKNIDFASSLAACRTIDMFTAAAEHLHRFYLDDVAKVMFTLAKSFYGKLVDAFPKAKDLNLVKQRVDAVGNFYQQQQPVPYNHFFKKLESFFHHEWQTRYNKDRPKLNITNDVFNEHVNQCVQVLENETFNRELLYNKLLNLLSEYASADLKDDNQSRENLKKVLLTYNQKLKRYNDNNESILIDILINDIFKLIIGNLLNDIRNAPAIAALVAATPAAAALVISTPVIGEPAAPAVSSAVSSSQAESLEIKEAALVSKLTQEYEATKQRHIEEITKLKAKMASTKEAILDETRIRLTSKISKLNREHQESIKSLQSKSQAAYEAEKKHLENEHNKNVGNAKKNHKLKIDELELKRKELERDLEDLKKQLSAILLKTEEADAATESQMIADNQKLIKNIAQTEAEITQAQTSLTTKTTVVKTKPKLATDNLIPIDLTLLKIPEIEPEIPEVVKYLMEEFEDEGVECYIVGGFIRDHLRGIKGKDVDIVINGPIPERMKKRFEPTANKQCFKRGKHVDVWCDPWNNDDQIDNFLTRRRKALISDNTFFCTRRGKLFDPCNVWSQFYSPYMHFVGSLDERLGSTDKENPGDPSLIFRIIAMRSRLGKAILKTDWDTIVKYLPKVKNIKFGIWLKHIHDLFIHKFYLDILSFSLITNSIRHLLPINLPAGYVLSEEVQFFWSTLLSEFNQPGYSSTNYHIPAVFIMLSVLSVEPRRKVDDVLNEFIENFKETIEPDEKNAFLSTTKALLEHLLKRFDLFKLSMAAQQGTTYTPGFGSLTSNNKPLPIVVSKEQQPPKLTL